MQDLRVYITGRDGVGWSIDHDRLHSERFLKASGAKLVHDPISASVLHSVWWPLLLNARALPLRLARRILRKKILAVVTNRLIADSTEYHKARKLVNLWVVANKVQLEILLNDGMNAAWQPFYVDETIFKVTSLNREDICQRLKIDYSLVKDKVLIGNFQRDTLGADLVTPKQQKDPERLLRIVSRVNRDRDWLLVLAGPRRHYVVAECERMGIPFLYVGGKPRDGVDDIASNLMPDSSMALLNNLIDCSLTTSQWEGGPKAILEAAYSHTYALSTPVGNAPELLHPECIFESDDEAIARLNMLVECGVGSVNEGVEYNFNNISNLCSYQPTLNRWQAIYKQLLEL